MGYLTTCFDICQVPFLNGDVFLRATKLSNIDACLGPGGLGCVTWFILMVVAWLHFGSKPRRTLIFSYPFFMTWCHVESGSCLIQRDIRQPTLATIAGENYDMRASSIFISRFLVNGTCRTSSRVICQSTLRTLSRGCRLLHRPGGSRWFSCHLGPQIHLLRGG